MDSSAATPGGWLMAKHFWENSRDHYVGTTIPLNLPFLGPLLLGFLGASDHLALVAVASGRPHFDGGILKGRRGDGDLAATLKMWNK